jgi:hypothetical protein
MFVSFIPNIEEFTQKHMICGEWATYEILVAISHLLKRDFLIITDKNEINYPSELFQNSDYPLIPLCYQNNNHFNVLLPKEGNIKIGFPEDAPLNAYLNNPSITLNFLKDTTKYNPSIQTPYPEFAGTFKNNTSYPSSKEKPISKPIEKKMIQTTLCFNTNKLNDSYKKIGLLEFKFFLLFINNFLVN